MGVVNKEGVLAGKVALVTGASRGIGEAIDQRYAMEGAKVVVSARTVEEADHYLPGTIKHTVSEIEAAGGEARVREVRSDGYGRERPADDPAPSLPPLWFFPPLTPTLRPALCLPRPQAR